jgi:hypothetical protein
MSLLSNSCFFCCDMYVGPDCPTITCSCSRLSLLLGPLACMTRRLFYFYISAGRRQARNSNVVIRRFMTELLHTVANHYTLFISEEYRGTYLHYQRERQYHLLHRKLIRWFINHWPEAVFISLFTIHPFLLNGFTRNCTSPFHVRSYNLDFYLIAFRFWILCRKYTFYLSSKFSCVSPFIPTWVDPRAEFQRTGKLMQFHPIPFLAVCNLFSDISTWY